jgi:hypothetical protein
VKQGKLNPRFGDAEEINSAILTQAARTIYFDWRKRRQKDSIPG